MLTLYKRENQGLLVQLVKCDQYSRSTGTRRAPISITWTVLFMVRCGVRVFGGEGAPMMNSFSGLCMIKQSPLNVREMQLTLTQTRPTTTIGEHPGQKWLLTAGNKLTWLAQIIFSPTMSATMWRPLAFSLSLCHSQLAG